MATNEYAIEVGTAATQNNYVLLYLDSGAGANPSYNVIGCRSATAVDADADILAINGITNTAFIDGTSTAISTTDTDIATANTSFPQGFNIIIASVQIDNGGTAQNIGAGNIKIKNTNGTLIASNEFAMTFGTATPNDIQHILIIGYDYGAASADYKVTMQIPNVANGEAKILVLQSKQAFYSDGGSLAVGSAATQLTSKATTFASNSDIAMVGTAQFDDTGTTIETYSATSGNEIREGSTQENDNEYAIQAFAAGGGAADGSRHSLTWMTNSSGASQTYDYRAIESANNAQNGEAKIIIFEIANPPQAYTQSPTESSPVSDVLSKVYTGTRTLTESSGVSDVLSSTHGYVTTLSESSGVSDVLSSVYSGSRSLPESSPISDLLSTIYTGFKDLSDSSGVSDVLSTVYVGVRSLSDTSGVSDALTTTMNFVKDLSDSSGVSDILSTIYEGSRTLSDTSGVSDVLTTVQGFVKNLSESSGVSDSLAFLYTGFRDFSESSTVIDDLNVVLSGLTQTLDETLGVSDTLDKLYTGFRNLADSASVIDDLFLGTDHKTFDDGVSVSDKLTVSGGTPVVFNAILIHLNSPNATRLGGVFADVCGVNQTMIGINYTGHIICAPFPP